MKNELMQLKDFVKSQQGGKSISLEFLDTGDIVSSFKAITNMVGTVLNGLINQPKLATMPLAADREKFLEFIKQIPYTSLMNMKVGIPEGMCVTYLHYIEVLEKNIEAIGSMHNEVLIPYVKLMSKIASDRDTIMSTDSQFDKILELEKKRDLVYDEIGRCFDKSNVAYVKYKEVIERNADLAPVLNKLNKLTQVCNSIDHDGIIKDIKLANNYLTAIKANIDEDSAYSKTISKQTVEKLANSTFQVAKEIEAVSDYHFKVAVLNSMMTLMIENIYRAYGG